MRSALCYRITAGYQFGLVSLLFLEEFKYIFLLLAFSKERNSYLNLCLLKVTLVTTLNFDSYYASGTCKNERETDIFLSKLFRLA